MILGPVSQREYELVYSTLARKYEFLVFAGIVSGIYKGFQARIQGFLGGDRTTSVLF